MSAVQRPEQTLCCECHAPIVGEVMDWWGGEPAHRGCAEAAWRKEWGHEQTAGAAGATHGMNGGTT